MSLLPLECSSPFTPRVHWVVACPSFTLGVEFTILSQGLRCWGLAMNCGQRECQCTGPEPRGKSPLVSACLWVLAVSHSDCLIEPLTQGVCLARSLAAGQGQQATACSPCQKRCCRCRGVWMMACSVTGHSAGQLASSTVLSPDEQASLSGGSTHQSAC